MAVICLFASCTEIENSPRYTTVLDYGAEYGVSYDFEFIEANAVINTGTCQFTNDSTMVVYNDNGATPFQQTYQCVGESIRVFYDNTTWETFDFNAADMTLVAQINETVTLTIYLN